MTEVMPSGTPPNPDAGAAGVDAKNEAGKPGVELSDLEKIKAAQAARRSRRTRSSALLRTNTTEGDGATVATPDVSADSTAPDSSADHDPAVAKLKEEIASMRLEMSSLRRNHLNNLKKVTEERDMFAAQLVREQSSSEKAPSVGDGRKVADVEAQLRASRTRNTDLEAENSNLRNEIKQLNFRVQASKTIEAATDGYERIVEDLVAVKLRCAQLEEEKEDLLRINKELSQTAAMLTEANGELEKSRSEWVLQCADLEKKKSELEAKMKDSEGDNLPAHTINQDTSYTGSDLQELKLN